MSIVLLILNMANAEPKKGFRVNSCIGIGSHCPFFSVGAAYHWEKFSIDVGGLAPYPITAHGGVNYYLSDLDQRQRWFVGASAGVGAAVLLNTFSAGFYAGYDHHFRKNPHWIFTPRLGLDIGAAIDLINEITPGWGIGTGMYILPSFSVEFSKAL